MKTSNADVANLLRSAAAALTIKKGNQFKIRAYESAADAIEHLTSEIKDLWEEKKLDQVPGIGENLQKHLEEYFKTGKVSHFESLMKGVPKIVFELLDIPGVGPKTALEIADLGVGSLSDLKEGIKSGKLVKKGFSAKIAEKIALGLEEVSSRKSGRMLLPYASAQAEKILEYIKKGPGVKFADPLGSLRRQVATIGDLDFAASAEDAKAVIDYFVKMPGIARVLDQGENMAHVVLESGLEVDLLVGKIESYGALLQHFTGSRHHNIKLRTYAERQGLSISEHGVTPLRQGSAGQGGKIIECKTEDELYQILKMQTPAPEIREDNGEIEAALAHKLPKLVEVEDIKGDLHTHSNFSLEPSHGPGANDLEEVVKKGKELGYSYIGLADHPPSFTTHNHQKIIELIAKRTKHIEQLKSSHRNIRVLNSLEIDILPDGSLSVPDEALKTLDYVLAGVHSSHRMPKDKMTKRILKALENPYVHIISHPTGRLLNERQSFEADWEEIFKYCAKNKKLLEINAYPNRLDLRDDLVHLAKGMGVKFVIGSDSHQVDQMVNMRYGVSVARRGWLTKEDIVNCWDFKDFAKWFGIE